MTPELFYLSLTTLLTALLWIPYTLNMISVRGLADAVGYPEHPRALAPWAARLKNAHANAVENLVVFAALVLVADALAVSGPATAMSSMVFFWARLVHAVAYTFAIPWVRTLAFVVGFLSQMCSAWQILAG
ncbi:MAG: MAPEG family protein [Gammaproteobacteria bacterium]